MKLLAKDFLIQIYQKFQMNLYLNYMNNLMKLSTKLKMKPKIKLNQGLDPDPNHPKKN